MTYSHRVLREFPLSDGSVAVVGSYVSDADWTHGGRQYVESQGWVIPLTPSEIAVIMAQANHNATVEPDAPVVETPATEAKKPVAKKAPAKKAPAKKTPAKKAAAATAKKAAE